MIDMKANKVVFAEANKEFVDFIFSLMSLPLSYVTHLLLANEKGMVGCLGSLYKSIESLDTRCFELNINSNFVLEPRSSVSIPLLSSVHDSHIPEFGSSSSFGVGNTCKGYVTGGAIYMVTDNLEVKQMSIAHIRAHAKGFDDLEEKQVEVGRHEGLAILKSVFGNQ